MTWPSQSPDVNPIEKLWEELDRKVRLSCPKSKNEMWQILEHAWNSLELTLLNKLIKRMPRLCHAVIKS